MNITNEKITDYLDSLYKPVDEDLYNLRLDNEAQHVPLIYRETEGMLSLLLSVCKPERILEIGTAHGYSALFFAKSVPDGHVTTIDRYDLMINEAEKNFSERPEGQRITLLKGEARGVLDDLINEAESSGKNPGFDFVFIDAGKSHYREFFDRAEKLCNPGALVVCDNILMHGWMVDLSVEGGRRHRTNVKYMKQFLEYINGREDLTVSLISSGDGLAVIKLGE